jgi:predicted AlkP superfamily pyrophosphatase or phosphodiesterase
VLTVQISTRTIALAAAAALVTGVTCRLPPRESTATPSSPDAPAAEPSAVAALPSPPPPDAWAADGGRGLHVVLVSIDGLRPEEYLNADAERLAIPTLRALMKRGRYARAVTGTWPTVTYPAHTTLVTGARPNRHGILGNRPFDPLYRNQGGWNWYAESIKADTLWAAARRSGKTTGSAYWPVTVGAAIDDDFPQVWRAKTDEDDKLLRALMVPGLVRDYEARYGALPAEHRTDHERGNAAEFLLRDRHHDLTLVYFTDLDEEQHASGPGSARAHATLERIDTELGRVVAAVDASPDAARTAVVVVSDHGFAPVSQVVRPAVLLRAAGLIDVAGDGTVTGYRAGVLAAGGLAAIYLKDPADHPLRDRVRKLLDAAARDPRNGIRAVVGPEVFEAAGGFAGASFALEAAPGFEFDYALGSELVLPASGLGAHGYVPDDPRMAASLIAAGAGIRPGPPLPVVSMLAIAPTVARLLGVTLADAEASPIGDLLDGQALR